MFFRKKEQDKFIERLEERFQALEKRFQETNRETSTETGQLEQLRQKCGISIIGQCGDTVNYDLHEVIEAVDTTNPAQDKTIAGIYRCGYIYKGVIKKKAQVSAYRAVKND